jgi:hypothetical protein
LILWEKPFNRLYFTYREAARGKDAILNEGPTHAFYDPGFLVESCSALERDEGKIDEELTAHKSRLGLASKIEASYDKEGGSLLEVRCEGDRHLCWSVYSDPKINVVAGIEFLGVKVAALSESKKSFG